MVTRLEILYLHLTEDIQIDTKLWNKNLIAIEANLGIKINVYTSMLM